MDTSQIHPYMCGHKYNQNYTRGQHVQSLQQPSQKRTFNVQQTWLLMVLQLWSVEYKQVVMLSAIAQHKPFLHHIICQSVYCTKLSGYLEKNTHTVMNILNFNCWKFSLQHHIFHLLLAGIFGEHTDLLIYNTVRFPSKGKVLDCELDEEMASFKHKWATNPSEYMLEVYGRSFLSVRHFSDTWTLWISKCRGEKSLSLILLWCSMSSKQN